MSGLRKRGNYMEGLQRELAVALGTNQISQSEAHRELNLVGERHLTRLKDAAARHAWLARQAKGRVEPYQKGERKK